MEYPTYKLHKNKRKQTETIRGLAMALRTNDKQKIPRPLPIKENKTVGNSHWGISANTLHTWKWGFVGIAIATCDEANQTQIKFRYSHPQVEY